MKSGRICGASRKPRIQTSDILVRHVLVHELGERLLLPDLKVHVPDLVLKDIQEDGLFYRPTCDLVCQLLKDAYTRTAEDDDVLRSMITAYCAEQHLINEYEDYRQAMDIVREHEKVGWKVGIIIQLKAEKREAETYLKAVRCHSSSQL